MTVQPYQYAPLPPSQRSIRILELSAGQGTDALRGTLHAADLDEDPAYEAISYVWGPSQPPDMVFQLFVGETFLPMTSSLDKALRRLRRPTETRRLWADAICINQVDETEKSIQVRMMGDIYRKSSRTLVCLTADVKLPMHLRDPENKPVVNTKDLNILVAAFTQPWFKRAWVVQEYVVSPRCTFIMEIMSLIGTSSSICLG